MAHKDRGYYLEKQIEVRPWLGKLTTSELVTRFGVSRKWVRSFAARVGVEIPKSKQRHHFTPEMDERLGKETDCSLAGLWGMAPETVARRRRKLGISPTKGRRKPIDWDLIDPDVKTMSCKEVCKKWSLPTGTVSKRRKELGVVPGLVDNELITRNNRLLRFGRSEELARHVNRARVSSFDRLMDRYAHARDDLGA